ncbi:MAG: excinuclease ABC subunit UvrA [Phycisphaerales bacterium]|nr:excinuclease ABC subunit UvrA [Phycisphaerales bacterium]
MTSKKKTVSKSKATKKKASSKSRITPSSKSEKLSKTPNKSIRIRGAKEHNLKSLDIDIPRDQLVIITGLSGSGKSSLAFDTIFAEGQRKYMESLSAYARQFLDQLKKPDIEEIEGIPPTIAIEQRSASHNPRSTVATTTEIYDYLRLLFARCGTPRSWAVTKAKKNSTVLSRSGRVIESSSASQIVDHVMKFDESTRLMVLAPVVRAKKGFHKDTLEAFFKQGWMRARVNGDIVDLRETLKEDNENPLELHRHKKHSIDAVVDRIVIKPDADTRQRLVESIEAALRLAEGSVVIAVNDEQDRTIWTDHAFSEHFADPDHPEISLSELSPRVFSFNSPFGACPDCHGLGVILEFSEELVVPNMDVAILNNAIQPWKKNGPGGMIYPRYLRKFCRAFDIPQSMHLSAMSDDLFNLLMRGTDYANEHRTTKKKFTKQWEGVYPMLHNWFHKTESSWVKDHLHQYQQEIVCPSCHGDRLKISALHVTIESSHLANMDKAGSKSIIGRPSNDGSILNISELSRLNITDAIKFIEGLVLSKENAHIAEAILREIINRLKFLESVGLDYLSLDRRTATLSGGEAQRIRLATQVGSGLVGACYVLDEPTIGLHQRDNDRLIRTLRHLTDIGNTVLVVEHDEDTIRAADHIVDIGPGPGVHGGTVVAQGSISDITKAKNSLTGDYLSGRRKIEVPKKRRTLNKKKAMVVKGAKHNNLKNIDVPFPVGGMLCVTGVSGSGKSTLVNQILLRAAKQHVMGSKTKPGAHSRVTGLQHIDRIIEVDQSPIGRTPRSNPATYTGIFDDIRKVFTATKESKIRGYKPGRFSFNVASNKGGGRCEACNGQGMKKIEMHFLPDVFVECEVCIAKRYNRETLEVKYRGKNIADVLALTVEDACAFFENHPKILRFTTCLRDVGLGYITLGQPSTTLSGGEAQRVKLATELGKGTRHDGTPSSEHTLYILDEPTTGLHFEDINKLIAVLNRLADAGNTLIIIEHNLDVIKCADWVIDLGPEGGDHGGTLLATGTPEEVAKIKASYTGQYLKQMLV